MTDSHEYLEVFLKPGDVYFATRKTRIRTVLGSCVSLTVWHPLLKMGGMCHFMLPERIHEETSPQADGRYAGEAMALLLADMRQLKRDPGEFQVRLFGGANMFPAIYYETEFDTIGARNVRAGRLLIAQYGMSAVSEDVAGTAYRHLVFDVWSGEVLLCAKPQK
ncbi:hypothetical protein A9404_02150 [Halothiobacillus diazotrophicus]|uniref:Probable chemoreceptor glutamine deamidase CheD n=1 Tax=Halothiobacillus diazotrophicus TaxID=1860122 RepID=A0A191ZEQ4_9GAMM|nr:chemotaxis protein CheD [Halothiobacillus diazotrophicus]ANJ66340.1 hypothetical protein A9404_02150 [Halothiobacillus diazotrophicus]